MFLSRLLVIYLENVNMSSHIEIGQLLYSLTELILLFNWIKDSDTNSDLEF